MKQLLTTVAGLLLCGAAQACTCAWPLQPFQAALQREPLLLEGTVVQAKNPDASLPTVVLKVLRPFKGSAPSEVHLVSSMCAKTVWPGDMKVGQTYIVSLAPDTDLPSSIERLLAQQEKRAPKSLYVLPSCAESALLREGDELFTFALPETRGQQREKRFYAKYPDFVRRHGTPPPSPARAAAR